MLEIMGRATPRLRVRPVDPDQHPGLASRLGVRVYNVAVLESDGRGLQVVSTQDRDIALGIVRVTRASVKTICFAAGHGEYDIDNFEYHTHFEGVQAHSHGAEGAGVVLMEQHGVARLRRALESLGFAAPKVTLAAAARVPGVTVAPLVSSSAESYVRPLGAMPAPARRAHVLAAAAEGVLPGASDARPFRLVVVGDGDFASNSFFPYMSNSDLVLAMLAWLVREERAPTLKPPVEVLPTVVLTNRQVRGIFMVTVMVLPGLAIGARSVVWWRRRR